MRTVFLTAIALLILALPSLAALVHHTPAHHHRHHRAARQAAAAPATKSVQVWVNTKTGVYHYLGERWYGNTKEGKYLSEDAAKAEGDRATENGQ